MKNINKSRKRFLQVTCTLVFTSLLASACTNNDANNAQTNKNTSVNNQQGNDNLYASSPDKSSSSNANGSDLEKPTSHEQSDSANSDHTKNADKPHPSKGEDSNAQVMDSQPNMTSSHGDDSMPKKENEKSTASASTQSDVSAPNGEANSYHPPSGNENTHTDGNPKPTVHQTENSPPPAPPKS